PALRTHRKVCVAACGRGGFLRTRACGGRGARRCVTEDAACRKRARDVGRDGCGIEGGRTWRTWFALSVRCVSFLGGGEGARKARRCHRRACPLALADERTAGARPSGGTGNVAEAIGRSRSGGVYGVRL